MIQNSAPASPRPPPTSRARLRARVGLRSVFWLSFPARDAFRRPYGPSLSPAPLVWPRRGLRFRGVVVAAPVPEPRGSQKARPRRGGRSLAVQGAPRAAGGRLGRSGRGLAGAGARGGGRRQGCPCKLQVRWERTGGRDMGRVRSARGRSPDLFHFPSHSAPGCAADGSSSRSARATLTAAGPEC